MTSKPVTEQELAEILKIAQQGENKLREMSDYGTILAEKWRSKTQNTPNPVNKGIF